jgi:hypothetical protein
LSKTKHIVFIIQNIDIQNNLKICQHSTQCLMNNNLNSMCICNENINHTKYLRIYIYIYIYNSCFKWKNHIEYLISLSHKFFYVFFFVIIVFRYILDKTQLGIIYISLVQSTISYGIELGLCLWYSSKKTKKKL